MPDRYWVGGTATWDATAGTKWAATSGGAGGESVPTASDDVYFDANSGAVTVTISASSTNRGKNVNFTGFTGTITGTGRISASGSLTLDAGMTVSGAVGITMEGTGTLTTAAKTIYDLRVAASGNTVTLGDALTTGVDITINAGTFDTAGYNVTANALVSNTTSVRTLNFNSSTLTLPNAVVFTNSTNLTLNAGTSQINCSSPSSAFNGGSRTFYNVAFTGTNAGTRSITGANTFNDLSVTAPSSAGVAQLTFDNPQTINGTFSTSGTAGNRRVLFRSNATNLARTLTINGSTSLTDADFENLYVVGTAAPISGTRIGDRRGCDGITFSTPKSVYRIGTGNWSDDQWASSSGGSPSTDYFPLAQDTAVFDESTTGGTHTMNSAVAYTGTVDMSARTSALTLSVTGTQIIYGDWTNGSGITLSGSSTPTLTFSGRNTQTITSAGKTFNDYTIVVDSLGGAVELADALSVGSGTSKSVTVTNGTFDTKDYNLTTGLLNSSNSNVRSIVLGSSTLSLNFTPVINFSGSTNLTFDAGTSTINCSGGNIDFNGGNQSFYIVNFNNTVGGLTTSINNSNTFNTLSFSAPASAGIIQVSFSADQTITGTFTTAGASAVRRRMLRSSVLGTTRTLTVGTLSADDCDFRDITIAGTAAGGSPTRAGDCGGNSGVNFPAPKTVYWNLAGSQNWSADGWATTSGGSPATNNFPLAQDTAVFDNTGSVGTVTIDAGWNIGELDASSRTSAMTLTNGSSSATCHKDWKFGTGVTSTSIGNTITFAGRGTQTITSNGVTFGCPVNINCVTGTVQLADAIVLDSARSLTLTGGTFDTASYNVTAKLFSGSYVAPNIRYLKMGASVWTCPGTGNVWFMGTASPANWVMTPGTSEIILSDTTSGSRTFDGSGYYFNKLTIGGATGTSTTTISGSNTFGELASTKTVAHTIALFSTTQTFGKWSVTGTSGNVVTLTGTGTNHILAGSCTSGIDYLNIGSIRFSASSPAEFYAGANSTATGSPAAPTYLTDKPADSTRYWVGGTGNWNDTNRWSTTSGGAGGADLPRSHDDVVFDSSSNATAYTATVNAITGGNRCKALTIAGPASGNVTLAGSTALYIHDNITLPATGLTRTYTGQITLTGSTSGKTITTNGVGLASTIEINGAGCEWTLGSAISSSLFRINYGSFATDNYSLTTQGIASTVTTPRSINLGSSTVSISGFNAPVNLGTTEAVRAALTFNAGTSTISVGASDFTFSGNNQSFYDVSFTSTSNGTATINGANTFNDLSVAGRAFTGIANIALSADQTINGTLTLSAGTDATMRTFVRSNTLGTTRTLTCNAVSATDADFRDITIAGTAAPASGTRLGDCKGNSGITFDAPKTVYWRSTLSANWGSNTWAASDGGSLDVTQFPLAQDTAVFSATYPNSGFTATINAAYNIGTIDMSARTTNTMPLTTLTTPVIYGNWINGTGTTLSGGGSLTFAGRGSQTITSAGRPFSQRVTVDTLSGSVTLQDALETSISGPNAVVLNNGTLDANNYNLTLSGASSEFSSSNSNTRTIAMGSGTWTIAGSGGWGTASATGLTVTGTGVISLTSASSKTFAGGGVDYSGITLNQGGTGTLTVSGNNSFANITKTTSAATTIAFASTTQRLGAFRARGRLNKPLTLTGNPCNLVFTGTGEATNQEVNYLILNGIIGYPTSGAWDAGVNSTNIGSLGWAFTATPPDPPTATGNFFMLFI